MGKFKKLFQKILSGSSDNNIDFDDVVRLLIQLGFNERIKGSHHIFHKEGVEEIINIQPLASKAKNYQVKQIRELIIKYKLAADDTEI